MVDYDILVTGLDALQRDEVRHVLRHVLVTLGDRVVGPYDAAVAQTALARLTREQHRTLIAYCRGFLLPEPAEPDTHHLDRVLGVVGYDTPTLRAAGS